MIQIKYVHLDVSFFKYLSNWKIIQDSYNSEPETELYKLH